MTQQSLPENWWEHLEKVTFNGHQIVYTKYRKNEDHVSIVYDNGLLNVDRVTSGGNSLVNGSQLIRPHLSMQERCTRELAEIPLCGLVKAYGEYVYEPIVGRHLPLIYKGAYDTPCGLLQYCVGVSTRIRGVVTWFKADGTEDHVSRETHEDIFIVPATWTDDEVQALIAERGAAK